MSYFPKLETELHDCESDGHVWRKWQGGGSLQWRNCEACNLRVFTETPTVKIQTKENDNE